MGARRGGGGVAAGVDGRWRSADDRVVDMPVIVPVDTGPCHWTRHLERVNLHRFGSYSTDLGVLRTPTV